MMEKGRSLALSTFIALYTSLMVLAPILSNRLVEIGHFKIVLGGLFAAIAAGLLDVVNNNWGMNKARETVLASLIVRFVTYALIFVAIMFIPVVREPAGFQDIMVQALRLLFAAEIAGVVSQYFIDIPLFNWMKNRFNFFLLRYNFSNVISQIIQGVTFVYIGFYGTDKQHLIPHIIVGGFVLKYAVQFSFSPIMAALAYWTKPQDVRNT